jgi:hypothetical protein
MAAPRDWERKPVPQSVLDAVDGTPGMLSLDEAALLYHLARQLKSGSIVEVGSYRGRSTVALALGAQSGGNRPVYAIEPHEQFVGVLGGQFGPQDRAAFFRSMLKTACYKNVRLVNLSSEVITPGWRDPVSLLWLDGDHSYAGVKRDFDCWRKHLSVSAHIVFDDVTDQRLGPFRLVNELLDSGEYDFCYAVGKIAVIKAK